MLNSKSTLIIAILLLAFYINGNSIYDALNSFLVYFDSNSFYLLARLIWELEFTGKKILLHWLLFDFFFFLAVYSTKRVVCYYTNWAQYRGEGAKFYPENIDPHLCTHIIYSFAKLDSNGNLAAYEWNDESVPWSKGFFSLLFFLFHK